jgi:hypothetical protein
MDPRIEDLKVADFQGGSGGHGAQQRLRGVGAPTTICGLGFRARARHFVRESFQVKASQMTTERLLEHPDARFFSPRVEFSYNSANPAVIR